MSDPLTLARPDDPARAAGLRTMKARATGLLVGAAVVFVLARLFHADHPWLDYVLAAAEGAMVGGLADWFAVTALFRHPLGIPVPHTALIPTRKDQLGVAIGEFVEENFLTGTVVLDKLRSVDAARRVATWASGDENAATVARHASAAMAGVAGVLRDEAVQGALEQSIGAWVRRVPLAPVAGRALRFATQDGRHKELLDAAFVGGVRFLDEHRDDLRSRFGRESPWWVPDAIDDRVFAKIFDALRAFLIDVGSTPNHEFRAHLERRIHELADRLQHDPELLRRGEELKEQLLAHPAVRSWTMSVWTDVKELLQRQAGDPSSQLRRRIADEVAVVAARIADDDEMLAKIDGWIESAALYLLDEQRHHAGEMIASTVARWDPGDAAQRVELAVGRDLQFIRINGSVVGGLAGLVIYSVGQLIG